MLLFTMKNGILILNFLLLYLSGISQVKVDNKLIFNSTDSTDNKITNTAVPQESSQGVNAGTVSDDQLVVSPSTQSGDTVNVTLTIFPDTLKAGFMVRFAAADTNGNFTFLKINSLSPFSLKSGLNELVNGVFQPGDMVTCMFDGNNFQVISIDESFTCPTGFVNVNDRYCIEKNERPLAYFQNAVNACGNRNARLCTWSEWQFACTQDGALGLNNMRTNFEFLNDASDHSEDVALIGNGGSCNSMDSVATSIISTSYRRNYRCCYSK